MKTFQRVVWDIGYKKWVDCETRQAKDSETLAKDVGGIVTLLGTVCEAFSILDTDGKPYWKEVK